MLVLATAMAAFVSLTAALSAFIHQASLTRLTDLGLVIVGGGILTADLRSHVGQRPEHRADDEP